MGIYDIYSKRGKTGTGLDVFQYLDLPDVLRVQIHHIIKGAIGRNKGQIGSLVFDLYNSIHKVLKMEWGVFSFGYSRDNSETDILSFILKSKETEKVLDVIECCFKDINTSMRNPTKAFDKSSVEISPDDATSELNYRFREQGVGYLFESNRIIRIDSMVVHEAVTKPTLNLLSTPLFTNANEEYLKAHEHYRHARNKEALAECLKAFESTMKIILKAKGWSFDENDTANKLIRACFDNNLVPPFLQSQLPALKTVLESGVPTVRNKVGGHGQGTEKKEADDELVRYALNLTGSNIIFLVELSGLT